MFEVATRSRDSHLLNSSQLLSIASFSCLLQLLHTASYLLNVNEHSVILVQVMLLYRQFTHFKVIKEKGT